MFREESLNDLNLKSLRNRITQLEAGRKENKVRILIVNAS